MTGVQEKADLLAFCGITKAICLDLGLFHLCCWKCEVLWDEETKDNGKVIEMKNNGKVMETKIKCIGVGKCMGTSVKFSSHPPPT